MIRAYDDNGNVVDLVKWEEQIRADERTKVFDEIAEDFDEHLFDSPMMNPIMTRNEILLFLEQLKEQKGGAEYGYRNNR